MNRRFGGAPLASLQALREPALQSLHHRDDGERLMPHPRTPNAWFALDESCPLMFFAGICAPAWTSVRKVQTGIETIDLFAFLTTEPNGIVAPVHLKAMPVLLTEQAEV